MATTNLSEAIKVVQQAMLEDQSEGSYFHSWQANIAMAFYDEAERFCQVNKKKSLNDGAFAEVGSRAAKNFLNSFLSS